MLLYKSSDTLHESHMQVLTVLLGKKISVEMRTWKKSEAPPITIKIHLPRTSEMQESRDVGKKD